MDVPGVRHQRRIVHFVVSFNFVADFLWPTIKFPLIQEHVIIILFVSGWACRWGVDHVAYNLG